MKASWKIDKVERGGLLGSKTKYNVFTRMILDANESELVATYSPHDPWIKDFMDLPEDVENKIGLQRASSHQPGVNLEVDSIQVAGKYKDGVLEAFQSFKVQIDAAAARVASLGVLHEMEL